MSRVIGGGLVLAAIALVATGCQLGAERPARDPGEPAARSASVPDPPKRRLRRISTRLPRCAPNAQNCRSATGRVVYVEAVDPDGDGDAHVVLASRRGITLPGLTVVDIPARRRPDPLPRRGDWVGATGPVFPGSRGQRQIEARRLRVRRLRPARASERPASPRVRARRARFERAVARRLRTQARARR